MDTKIKTPTTSNKLVSLTVWLTVAFTFERLIVVRYPLKRPAMCTIGRTKLIISCLSIVTLVVQAYSLITTGVTENGMAKADVGGENDTESSRTVERRCGLYPNYYQAMRVINTIDTFITLVIPIILIVSMNALIVHSLFKSSRSFGTNEDKHQYPSTASSVKSNRSCEADNGDKQQSSTSLTLQNDIQVSI